MTDKVLSDESIALVKAANLPVSLSAIEEIIFEEDSSEWYYLKHYQHPEWPGGASGITVCLGYDLGYASASKIHHDFDGLIPESMIQVMIGVSGLTGPKAHAQLSRVRGLITIPWSAALSVFLKKDMPAWIDTVHRTLPNTDKLGPTCLGVLVSLAYNRGASFDKSGDRYREMRAIKGDMATQNFADIPHQLKSMARLWTGGVHDRRLREAALFEKGLVEMKGVQS